MWHKWNDLRLLKQHLRSYQFHNNEEVEMVVHEWLQRQELKSSVTEFLMCVRMEKCISVLKDFVEK